MSPGKRRSGADAERQLRDLAQELEIPAPDYSDRVLRALATGNQQQSSFRRSRGTILQTRRRQVLIAVAVVLIAAAVAIAVPGSRRALAQWFGFAGIEIHHTHRYATPPPPSKRPVDLQAGSKVSLAEARAAMAGRLQLSPRLPTPAPAYLPPA